MKMCSAQCIGKAHIIVSKSYISFVGVGVEKVNVVWHWIFVILMARGGKIEV